MIADITVTTKAISVTVSSSPTSTPVLMNVYISITTISKVNETAVLKTNLQPRFFNTNHSQH